MTNTWKDESPMEKPANILKLMTFQHKYILFNFDLGKQAQTVQHSLWSITG